MRLFLMPLIIAAHIATFAQAQESTSLPQQASIISLKKIWDEGEHNAFTDLIRWHDHWYCTFRESKAHVGGDGKIRVLQSKDGEQWQSIALLGEMGIDLRDPKLSVTPDDRLMLVMGGSVYEGKTLKGRQPRVAFSNDAKVWTAPQRVLEEGDWLWRVTWHQGRAYGVSYNPSQRNTTEAQAAAKTGEFAPGPADWKLKLVASNNGIDFETLTYLEVPGHANETTVRFRNDGTMMALVRREAGNKLAWFGTASVPYTQWQWQETKHQIGGPNFIVLPDQTMLAGGRQYPQGAKQVLATLSREGEYQPILTFPSGGDCSYPGFVWHENQLWMSYYSSHEGKSSIYFAKVSVMPQAAR